MDSEEKLDRWVNDRAVAEMTGIPRQTLRNKRSNGKGIPYSKIGRLVRYRLRDVVAYMEAGKVETASDDL